MGNKTVRARCQSWTLWRLATLPAAGQGPKVPAGREVGLWRQLGALPGWFRAVLWLRRERKLQAALERPLSAGWRAAHPPGER